MDPGARVSLEVKLGATTGADGTGIEEEEEDDAWVVGTLAGEGG